MNQKLPQEPTPDHPEIRKGQGLVTLGGGLAVLVGIVLVFAGWGDLTIRERQRIGGDLAKQVGTALREAGNGEILHDIEGGALVTPMRPGTCAALLEREGWTTGQKVDAVALLTRVDAAFSVLDHLEKRKLIDRRRKEQVIRESILQEDEKRMEGLERCR